MNRRKIFGILAAPVVAANVPVQSEIKSNLKPYSEFDFDPIFRIWSMERVRKENCLTRSQSVFFSLSYYLDFQGMEFHDNNGIKSFIPMRDLTQAFADACLNGEVPGVWWE